MKWWQKVLKKIVAFILSSWKEIVLIGGLVVGATIVTRMITRIVKRVRKEALFKVDPHDPHKIHIYDEVEKKWKPVILPKKVRSSQVKAAGFGIADGEMEVEIKHSTVDRRFNPPVDDSWR